MLEDLLILGFKEIYVQSLTNHYVNQRFQWLYMTKNTNFTELVHEKSLPK